MSTVCVRPTRANLSSPNDVETEYMNSPGLNLTRDSVLRPNVIEGQFSKSRVKALTPRGVHGTPASLNEKPSRRALLFVLFAHVCVFAVLISISPIKPSIKAAVKPMLVSLIANPAPEPKLAPLLPTPPEPKPVIKKQKPKLVVLKDTPQPQPIAPEQPAIEQAPSAIVSEPQAVVAKAPEALPVVEPKIEPPRFGVAYLENPPPAYPSQSRRLREEGRVFLRVLVTEKGNAETVQIEKASGFEKLDQSALETVKKWRFIPAKHDGQPVSAYVIVPINFSLED
jgi:periplasmic protein TonB